MKPKRKLIKHSLTDWRKELIEKWLNSGLLDNLTYNEKIIL